MQSSDKRGAQKNRRAPLALSALQYNLTAISQSRRGSRSKENTDLVRILEEATERLVARQPGFVRKGQGDRT
jgi:hypothetical protein